MSARDYFAQDAADLCGKLSPRQREVLVLLAKGLTARAIADMLGLGEFTVIDHKKSIFRALDVGTIAEASVLAAKAGIA